MNRPTLLASLILGAVAMQHSPVANADTVRCESNNGNYQSCSANTSGGVRLSRQLSSQGCWQNDTWGYDRNRIWVARGCRAEFETGRSGSSSSNKDNAVAGAVVLALVGAAIIANKNKDKNRNDDYYDNGNGYYDDGYDNGYNNGYGNPRQTFRCESKSGNFTYCNQNGNGHVEVYKQLSSANCTYGQSWGVDGRRVWVSNGCRAEFAVY